jgi:hypothetical protein
MGMYPMFGRALAASELPPNAGATCVTVAGREGTLTLAFLTQTYSTVPGPTDLNRTLGCARMRQRHLVGSE